MNKTSSLEAYNVLYVEDNFDIKEEVEFFLEPMVKTFYGGNNGEEGLALFKEHRPDIIITDIQMPKMNGLQMIEQIREIDATVPIVITTAFNESEYLIKAINLQVDGYLMKPLNLKELIFRLVKIIEPIELKKQLINKNSELEEINTNLDEIARNKTKELEYFYKHDPLTGLFNFMELAHDIEKDEYSHLLLLDISNFSVINKQYGKDFSNLILKSVSVALAKHVTQSSKLFKVESDRFVFLMKEKDSKMVEHFCKQLISFFDTEAIEVEGVEISMRFSMGISNIDGKIYPLVDAEYALEISKEFGSRYYYFYDDSIDSVQKSKDAIKWLNATKQMIEEDKIEPYYQAIQDVGTGEIIKYEVLARGNYQGEIIAPYLFLSSAERLGLMGSITRMMINKSFAYFEDKKVSFSINLTQRDLLDNELIGFLEDRAQRYNMDPSRVTFEILENVTVSAHHTTILAMLETLKKVGFEIAIDDFGIENSSFSRLLEIDFNYLKIDGIFIKKLEHSEKDRTIVCGIVGLAKALGIKTIAEFVENEKIYENLVACGVDMAQGYYIGKPGPKVI